MTLVSLITLYCKCTLTEKHKECKESALISSSNIQPSREKHCNYIIITKCVIRKTFFPLSLMQMVLIMLYHLSWPQHFGTKNHVKE